MTDYRHIRRQVIDAARWLSSHGYFGGKRNAGGNVSIRIPDADDDLVAITPSGVPYGEIDLEDICIVDRRQSLVSGRRPPSMETGLHLGIYGCRSEVGAVVHTHQPFASVLAVMNRPIGALFDEVTLALGPEVAVVPYAVSGSPELAANVATAAANGCNAYIMQNHGALALGPTMDKALRNAELLEKAAQVVVRALAAGGPVGELPPESTALLNELQQAKDHI